MRISSLLGITVGSLLLVGCSGTTPSLGSLGKSGNYESSFKTGNYKKIAEELKTDVTHHMICIVTLVML